MLSIILQRFRRKGRTLGVLLVLVFAMVLRGIVPAGYMPDPDAGRHGNPLLAFCAPDSGNSIPQALAALWADVDTDKEAPSAMAASCAFCILGQLAMDLPETGRLAVASVFFFSRPVVTARNPALPVQGSRGPPLGSRAPPFFIG